jgi:hypothetical protein
VPVVVEHLHKVTLSLQAGSSSDSFSLTPSPISFEFIYGIGHSGLSPFETAIHNKLSGESFSLTVSAKEVQTFFGSLFMSIRQALGLHLLPETIYLHIEITSVVKADDSEVVKAMADLLNRGGCDGSCDCGCS